MGAVAILWTIDCFVGFYLTTPARHTPSAGRPADVERALRRGWWVRWKPSWLIKAGGSRYRLNFESIALLAYGPGACFSCWPSQPSRSTYRARSSAAAFHCVEGDAVAFVTRTPSDLHEPIERACPTNRPSRRPAPRRPARLDASGGHVFYVQRLGFYGVRFFEGDDHGAAGVGPPDIYVDGADGTIIGDRIPWKGTLADIFIQAQFPLHSGRILGLPGRILISVMGVVVAVLSVTGVVIWYRKARARRAVRRGREQRVNLAPAE